MYKHEHDTLETGSDILSQLSLSLPFAKAGDIKSHSSVRQSIRLSVCHKNFNLTHIFWGINHFNDRTLIFGMHDPCDKSFLLVHVPWSDLDLWPTLRSNLLPDVGPQFFEFACFHCSSTDQRLRSGRLKHK